MLAFSAFGPAPPPFDPSEPNKRGSTASRKPPRAEAKAREPFLRLKNYIESASFVASLLIQILYANLLYAKERARTNKRLNE